MRKWLSVLVIVFSLAQANADEIDISFGMNYGIGVLEVDNDFGTVGGALPKSAYLFNEKSTAVSYTPGLGFTRRVFSEKSPYPNLGHFFHINMMYATAIDQTGTLKTFGPYGDTSTEHFSETFSSNGEDTLFTIAANFNLGTSRRFMLSKKMRFYADSGLSVTLLSHTLELKSKERSSLNYIGVGIFGNLAMQWNIVGKLYMEIGFNGILNFMSHQEGVYKIEGFDEIEYEDTGKFDLIWAVPYIHVGWYITYPEKP